MVFQLSHVALTLKIGWVQKGDRIHLSLLLVCHLFSPFHIYRERAPVSTAIAHPCPPPSRTRIHLRLAPVSSPLSRPCLPQPRARINLRLPLVISLEVTPAGSVKTRLPEA